jgi:hypothetical protein
MKKVSVIFALLFGLVAVSFAQTAPATRWASVETDQVLVEGANTVRMPDGSVVRFSLRSGEVFNLSVQSGRERVIFEGNEEAPAGAPTGKCANKWSVQHCYYSTKNKMVICICDALTDKPSSDPTAAKEHILLARQVGVAN